jgi:hypothetical protein
MPVETIEPEQLAKTSSEELDFDSLADIEPTIVDREMSNEPLREFINEVLRAPLPPEIAEMVEQLRHARNSESLDQQRRLAELIAELEHGVLGRWIKNGRLTPPNVVAEREQELEAELIHALEIYTQTEQGEQDAKIKTLRDFLDNPSPTKLEVLAMGRMLGINPKKITLPGGQAKYAQAVHEHAENSLNSLVPPTDDWSDRRRTWQQMAEKEKTLMASLAVDQAVTISSEEYNNAQNAFNTKYSHAHDTRWTPKGGIHALKEAVETLDKAQQQSADALTTTLSLKQDTLSAIARGSITIQEVIHMIQERSGALAHRNGRSLHGVFREEIDQEWRAAMNRLASPSLVGLSYSEQEPQEVKKCLEDIAHIKKLCRVEAAHINAGQNYQQVLEDIARAQKLFFERIDTPNSLYWHFTRGGLDIMRSGEMQSAELSGKRNTHEVSKGIHFIKPGLGIETRLQYHNYAQGHLTNSRQRLDEPFGMAVIYRLGDIMQTTPLRDEPVADPYKDVGKVAEDTTFRLPDESAAYAYPLEDAYLLPIASWEQLKLLREDERFADILGGDWAPPFKLAREVAARTLREAGYSEEWIATHLLDSEKLVDSSLVHPNSANMSLERDLFGTVGHAITSKIPEDKRVVIPLDATKGQFEPHDSDGGTAPELWKEKLVELEAI